MCVVCDISPTFKIIKYNIMKLQISVRRVSSRGLLVGAFLFFTLLYSPQMTHAAITDGLTITVNREAVSATALDAATVEIKCNVGSYVTLGTTNSSGIVSITDPVALATLLTNAGSCIVGSNLDIRITKDGYVTTQKLNAIASLLGVANSFTFTGSDAVKFAHKATITRESDSAALSGATVGVGATVCIESGSLGIYYCPVPLASDGSSISVAKTGYVTNTSFSVGNRTLDTDAQGLLSATGIAFQTKIIVADELGNSVTPTTITFDGATADVSSSNTYYFAPSSGLNKVIAITKAGFIPNALTNTALANVSVGTTGQTTITLGASAVSSSAISIGQTLSIKGLEYALKSTALKTEVGGTITSIANGTPSSASADVSLGTTGGASIIASAVASDTIYIAATGNGSADDTVTITLSNVTADGGSANASSFVVATIADTGNTVSTNTTQSTFGIGQATGTIQNTTGFLYPVKVTVADELGTAIPIASLTTKTLAGVAPSTTVSNVAYWATTPTAGALVLAENGYVTASTNNTGFTSVTANQTGATTVTLGSGSALTSAISAGSSGSGQGLQFGQKITLQTEAGSSLTGATVTAGSSNTSCAVVSNIAYCPVPITEDGTPNDITITKSGYVTSTTGDTGDRTTNASAQSSQTFSDVGYILKVVVNDSVGIPITGATVTHGGIAAATSVSNVYYFTTTGSGALVVSKTGFDSLNTAVDTGLAMVGVTNTAQTVVTLTGSTPFTGNLSAGGASVAGRGLVATVTPVVSTSGSIGSSGSRRQRFLQGIVPTLQQAPIQNNIETSNNQSIYPRNLSTGMNGTDVLTLQKFLILKKFLKLPTKSINGYFGSATKSALMKYQKSINIPATGFFGLMTRTAIQK